MVHLLRRVTGLIACWIVLIALAKSINVYWLPLLYCVAVTALEGIFCLGRLYIDAHVVWYLTALDAQGWFIRWIHLLCQKLSVFVSHLFRIVHMARHKRVTSTNIRHQFFRPCPHGRLRDIHYRYSCSHTMAKAIQSRLSCSPVRSTNASFCLGFLLSTIQNPRVSTHLSHSTCGDTRSICCYSDYPCGETRCNPTVRQLSCWCFRSHMV